MLLKLSCMYVGIEVAFTAIKMFASGEKWGSFEITLIMYEQK